MRREVFLEKLKKIHPRFVVIGTTSKLTGFITIRCRDCNNEFEVKREDVFKRNTVCPHCKFKRENIYNIKKRLSNKYMYKEFVDKEFSLLYCKNCDLDIKVKNIDILHRNVKCIHCEFPNIYDNENLSIIQFYTKSTAIVHCKKCKREFKLTKRAKYCPFCKAHEENIEKVTKICEDNNLELTSKDINFKNSIKYKCKTCNRPLFMGLKNFLTTKKHCKVCSSEIMSNEQFKKRIKDKNIEILSEYKGMNHKVKCKCKECKNEFEDIGKRVSGLKIACPECRGKYQLDSKGVILIKKWLNKENIYYETEQTFDGCVNINSLRFDFYLPEFNMCIEYDHIQHFEPIKYWGGEEGLKDSKIRDNIKNAYCKRNKIKLLRLKYTLSNESIKQKLYQHIYERGDYY